MREPSSRERRILLVGHWLKVYAQVYPMYGKTLSDFPDRFDAFLEDLADLPVAAIEAGFRECRKTSKEFPVPAQVRASAIQAAIQQREERSLGLIAAACKQLPAAGVEDLRREFEDLLRETRMKSL